MINLGRSIVKKLSWSLLLAIFITSLSIASVGPLDITKTNTAYAAGHSDNSQGDCSPGYPRATSWLNWWGQGLFATGTTNATLYHYDGANWISYANGQNTLTGDTENAQVTNTHGYVAGQYQQAGNHTSTFFSGTEYTNSGVWSC